MRANDYYIIFRAVEEGLEYGWNRAHKHVAVPSKEELLVAMNDAVTNAISEVYSFSQEDV